MSRLSKKQQIITQAAKRIQNEVINLLPKQKEFVFDPYRFTCLSGGFGSAKTFAGCMKGIIISALFPGNKGLVSRMTYPELRDSTRKSFFEILPPSWILNWNETFNILTLKNGSEVLFRPIDDIKKQRSLNLGWFYIDQAEECQREDFLDLVGRLRLPVRKQFGFVTVNPDGHNWCWQDFFNKPKKDYHGINSTTFDNPYLPPGYIQSLIDSYPKEWVDRFIYGSHDVKSGVILSEFNDDLVVDPFIIPGHWLKGRGMDWGIDKPCTKVSVAVDPNGVFYIFDCYDESGLPPEAHAEAILERDKGIGYTITKMDRTAWSKLPGSKNDLERTSVALQFIKAGLKMSPATVDFAGSLLTLKMLLKAGKVKFFRGRCDALIEEIKSWKWGRPVAGKETPAIGEDHLIDAMRYIISAMSGKVSPDLKVEEDTPKAQGRKVYIPRPGFNSVVYDSVTGFPKI